MVSNLLDPALYRLPPAQYHLMDSEEARYNLVELDLAQRNLEGFDSDHFQEPDMPLEEEVLGQQQKAGARLDNVYETYMKLRSQ